MKLFLFKCDTDYGEFIKIIAHKSLTEAFEQSDLPKKGWKKEDGIELIIPEEPGLVFEGGGDN